jgi:hypothetical protein
MLTVKDILTDRITLDIECVDRVYLNGYVKYLQLPGGLVTFIREQLGKPIADAYIRSDTPTVNYGSATTLYVGTQFVTMTARSLYRFDLSSIPAGATIVNASFQSFATVFSPPPTTTMDIELKRIDTAWSEGTVNWLTPLSYTGANNVIGVGMAPAYYSWDVTSLVQTWVDGAVNHGLALVSKNEPWLVYRGFNSKESGGPPPRLLISYQP